MNQRLDNHARGMTVGRSVQHITTVKESPYTIPGRYLKFITWCVLSIMLAPDVYHIEGFLDGQVRAGRYSFLFGALTHSLPLTHTCASCRTLHRKIPNCCFKTPNNCTAMII